MCFFEHHLRKDQIPYICIKEYKLVTNYCRSLHKNGFVCIFIQESLSCTTIDLREFCHECIIEACAMKLDSHSHDSHDNFINQVWTLVVQNSRITVRELADEVGVSIGSVHTIVTADLGLRSVSAKFVSKLLTMEQKQLRLEIVQDMLDCV